MNQNWPANGHKLTMIICLLNGVWPGRWYRSRGIGFKLQIYIRCNMSFRCSDISFRRHISVSHDNVIGFIGVGGGSFNIFNLLLMNRRVGHRHVHIWNCFFFNRWGSKYTYLFFIFLG